MSKCKAQSAASQSPEGAAVGGGGAVMVRRRGRSWEGLDAAELVNRPMRGGVRGGSVSQLFSSIEAGGGDRRFSLKPPRTSLARSSQLRRGRSGEPGGKG